MFYSLTLGQTLKNQPTFATNLNLKPNSIGTSQIHIGSSLPSFNKIPSRTINICCSCT